MTGAIIRLSYNNSRSRLSGMIEGYFIFITQEFLVTPYHVLNKKILSNVPKGFKSEYFFIFNKKIIRYADQPLFEFPDNELTFIDLLKPQNIQLHVLSKEIKPPPIGLKVHSQAHLKAKFPKINWKWENEIPIIYDYDFSDILLDFKGFIEHTNLVNIQFGNCRLVNTRVIHTSYEGHNGCSGSALFADYTNHVIGLIIATVKDENNKQKQTAVSSLEIIQKMKKLNLLKPWWRFW